MATVQPFKFGAADAMAVPGETLPEFKQAGSTLAVASYSFDAGGTESVQFLIPTVRSYGTGNWTVRLHWFADSASSGDVVWGASLAAVTSNTDTGNIESKAWATENTATDSHLGTTGQRLHSVDVTVSNLDSVANGDVAWLRIRRLGGNGSDTMTGDAQLVAVEVEYSDT